MYVDPISGVLRKPTHCSSCCRFFLGSNKVLQVALGKTDSEEYRDGTHKAAEVRKDDFCCQKW